MSLTLPPALILINRRAKGEVGGGGEESEVESNWSNDDDEVLLEVADY